MLIGTNFGQPKHPGLDGEPARAPRRRGRDRARAPRGARRRMVDDETWAQMFPRFVAVYPGYANYLGRREGLTPRMFRLDPRGRRPAPDRAPGCLPARHRRRRPVGCFTERHADRPHRRTHGMLNIIWIIIGGAIIGALARLVMPGKQNIPLVGDDRRRHRRHGRRRLPRPAAAASRPRAASTGSATSCRSSSRSSRSAASPRSWAASPSDPRTYDEGPRTLEGRGPCVRAGRVYPLTEPASRPRTKNRWSEKNTISGTMIATNAPAVIRCSCAP